jgi:hypothetical protein
MASSRPGRARSSAKIVCSSAATKSASVPGRMGWWTSATAAVSVRRGSTTMSRPPRLRSRSSRFPTLGAVITLPFDTSGLAPSTSRSCVRSRSGMGMTPWFP